MANHFVLIVYDAIVEKYINKCCSKQKNVFSKNEIKSPWPLLNNKLRYIGFPVVGRRTKKN